NDDGGRDVRHDVESEDRHPVNAATGKHIEHAEDAARLGTEDLVPSRRIDTGQRYVGAEAVDQERAEREPDPLLELLGFSQRREIEIGGELFCCRDHRRFRSALENSPRSQGRAVSLYRHQAGYSLVCRCGASNVTEPPTFSTASLAALDAPQTESATLALISPDRSNGRPSWALLSTPAFTSASASTVAPASSLPASIDA